VGLSVIAIAFISVEIIVLNSIVIFCLYLGRLRSVIINVYRESP